jgi:hypothetical protein
MALEFETTKDPNAVENIFCAEMSKGVIEPLSEDMMKILITLITNKPSLDEMHREISSQSMLLNILEDRIKSMNKEIDKGASIFVSLACETPGEVVMYSYYISYMMKRREIGQKLDLETLCTAIFPMGMFTRESLGRIWDSQKVKGKSGSDNLLDYLEASKSLNYEL